MDALGRLDRHEADGVAAKIDRVSRSTTDFAHLLDKAEKGGSWSSSTPMWTRRQQRDDYWLFGSQRGETVARRSQLGLPA